MIIMIIKMTLVVKYWLEMSGRPGSDAVSMPGGVRSCLYMYIYIYIYICVTCHAMWCDAWCTICRAGTRHPWTGACAWFQSFVLLFIVCLCMFCIDCYLMYVFWIVVPGCSLAPSLGAVGTLSRLNCCSSTQCTPPGLQTPVRSPMKTKHVEMNWSNICPK